jgi:exportin-2 (importin alpha re-exporter)
MRGMIVTLLTHMQTSKTDKFAYLFTYYLAFAMAINAAGLVPDYLIGVMVLIQPGPV